jgi:hypothetical protein
METDDAIIARWELMHELYNTLLQFILEYGILNIGSEEDQRYENL